MTLPPGTRLGPYEVRASIGAGGMGEVYRALDTRLDRTVAVKVLPPHLAADPEFSARFEREARAISQLNHPHICSLYDVGRQGGLEYLVLEYLEGETLAARLAAGPLPLDQALDIGRQVCDALDAAHRAGFVHRDLKPGNVMLTRGARGAQATLLDFGLAKPATRLAATPADGTTAPTRSAPLTARGTILGTFEYMAPEQLEGRDIDARTDIWAFGCLLYEMISGRRPFTGTTPASVVGAILKDTPPSLSAQQPLVPATLDRVVCTCLEKSPEDRWQTARDLGRQLQWVTETADPPVADPRSATIRLAGTAAVRRGAHAPWVVAAAAGVAAVAAIAWGARPRPATLQPIEFDLVSTPASSAEVDAGTLAATLSPDGLTVAYSGVLAGDRRGLCLRGLERAESHCLENTANAVRPFWSPDGRQIAYFAAARLWVVSRDGGQPRAITDADYGVGGAWSPRGTIVFAPAFGKGLMQVPASGGTATPLTTLDAARGESIHAWPQFLPDGRRFLFVSRTTAAAGNRIEMAALDDGSRHVVTEADSLVGLAAPWLVFTRRGAVFAQRADMDGPQLRGEPVLVQPSVHYAEAWVTAGASVNGRTLAYVPHVTSRIRARWFGPDGTPGGTAFEEDGAQRLRISPDGRLALVQKWMPEDGADDLWIVDLANGATARLTTTRADEDLGTWSQDSTAVFYNTDDLGMYAILTQAADGLSKARPILSTPATDWYAHDVSPDGRTLLARNDSLDQLHLVPLDGPGPPQRVIEADFPQEDGRFSRDGAWIVFGWTRSGTQEVYVRARTGGTVTRVSDGGGERGAFSPDGRRVYYLGPGGGLFSVELTGDARRLTAGRPRLVLAEPGLQDFDVAPDGRLLVLAHPTARQRTVRARLGWEPN